MSAASSSAPPPRRPSLVLPLVLAFLGGCEVLIATAPHGVGLWADAAQYVAAANGVAAGRGYVMADGTTPYAVYAPLLPTVLALGPLLGGSVAGAARVLNAVTWAGLILIGGLLCRDQFRSRASAVLAMLSIAASPALAEQALVIGSDIGFFALVAATAWALARRLGGSARWALAASAGAAALASLQRYVGVFLLPVGAALLLLPRPAVDLRRRLRDAAVFLAVGAAPLVLWIARTVIVTGTATGPRREPFRGVAENAGAILSTMGAWLAPVPPPMAGVLGGVAVLLTLWPLVPLARRVRQRDNTSAPPPLEVGAAVGAAYLATLLAIGTVTMLLGIGDRYVAVVYVFVMLGLFGLVDRSVAIGPGARARPAWVRVAAISVAGLWVLYPAARHAGVIARAMIEGPAEYNRSAWQRAPIVQRLRVEPLKGPVYTNAPDFLYLALGVRARMSPVRDLSKVSAPAAYMTAQDPIAYVRGPDPRYLVWFAAKQRDYLVPLAELRARLDLLPLYEGADGGVYRIRAGATGPDG